MLHVLKDVKSWADCIASPNSESCLKSTRMSEMADDNPPHAWIGFCDIQILPLSNLLRETLKRGRLCDNEVRMGIAQTVFLQQIPSSVMVDFPKKMEPWSHGMFGWNGYCLFVTTVSKLLEQASLTSWKETWKQTEWQKITINKFSLCETKITILPRLYSRLRRKRSLSPHSHRASSRRCSSVPLKKSSRC